MHKIEFQDHFIYGLVNESTIVVDKNSVTQIIEVDRLNHIATPVFSHGENVTLFGCQHASSNGNFKVNELFNISRVSTCFSKTISAKSAIETHGKNEFVLNMIYNQSFRVGSNITISNCTNMENNRVRTCQAC